MALTPKQTAFVREYAKDSNAKQAAIRAGYSADTAETQGSRLFRNVQVQAALKAGANKAGITAERIIAELGEMAFARLDAVALERLAAGGSLPVRAEHKIKALELLGKHLALFTDKVKHTFDGMADEQLEARYRELIAKAGEP